VPLRIRKDEREKIDAKIGHKPCVNLAAFAVAESLSHRFFQYNCPFTFTKEQVLTAPRKDAVNETDPGPVIIEVFNITALASIASEHGLILPTPIL
jgi:hypothetical protein